MLNWEEIISIWGDQGRLSGRGGVWDEKALGRLRMGMRIPSQEKQKQSQRVPVAWRQRSGLRVGSGSTGRWRGKWELRLVGGAQGK